MYRHHREPTIPEILSDPIVKAVMAADGIDHKVLLRQLRKRRQEPDQALASQQDIIAPSLWGFRRSGGGTRNPT
jgi:hypothetical protein